MHRLRLVPLAVALMFVAASPVRAQRTTATLTGIVADTSAGILPGADVTLTNDGTGIVEQQVTNEVGEFVFNYVPPGSYRLLISISGFKTQTVRELTLGAGQNVRRRFELEVGSLEESITVSGAAPLVDTASTEQRITLESAELASLPTANRNLSNLLNIGAGLTRQEQQVEGGGAGGASAGTVRLRLNGLGGQAMSITANGTEASANAGSRSISSYNGVSKIDLVSMEAVAEVNIVKGIMPAEFGNAMAGNLNVITRAGTNALHGSLFHRYEGAGLVAKPFFLSEKPEATWNQGGGSVGGPLLRDRAFFFAAFEAYRLTRGLEINANVPTQRFRQLLMTAMPYPETNLLLDQYPLPTQPHASTALLGTFIGAGEKENTDDHVDARADFRIFGGNLSTSFTYGHPFLTQAQTLPGQHTRFETTSRRASGSFAITRAQWSSETRFGYNYSYLSRVNPGILLLDPINPGPLEPVTARDRRMLPTISFPGLQSIGTEAHVRGHRPSYSIEQQLTLVTNRHAFKFGGVYSRPQGGRSNVQGATLSYLTEAELVANRPSSASFRPVSIDARWLATNWGLFLQDDWRINSKLVVNMGVRYDYFGRFQVTGTDPENPAGFLNLDGQPDETFAFGALRTPERIVEDDKGVNLAPRIGVAYNPDGRGNTVFNGGWGMMFQGIDPQAYEGMQIGTISGIPANRTYSAAEVAALGLRYPVYNDDIYNMLKANPVSSPLALVGSLIDPNIQAPYAHVFTAGVQHAIGAATVVNAAYVGTRGYQFRMFRQFNLPDRITGLRPNRSLNEGNYMSDDQETTYDSLQTSFRQRLTKNLTFNLNYTWSSSRANYDGDNGVDSINDEGRAIQEFFDIDANWGPAQGDVRHSFIGDVIYVTSGEKWSSPWARHVLGSWQLSTIFRVRSGEPLNIGQSGRSGARPDVIDAANAINQNCCDISSGNLQYLNPAAFQLVPLHPVSRQPLQAGTVMFNQFRRPGFKNIDLSAAKFFLLGAQRRVEIRADILNALNWINYVAVATNRSSANFGQVTGTGAARVMQVQLRFSF